jgi:CheY-like chemotaxis protein
MRRILIVDDSALVRNSIQAALERFGFEFGHADTGEAALAKAASGSWDLIFLDVVMPVMDGPTALRALRARGDQTPVVLVTSVSTATVVAGAVKLGAVQYVAKPFTPALIATLALRQLRLGPEPPPPPRVLVQHGDPALPARLAKALPPHVVIDATTALAESLDHADRHRPALILLDTRDPIEEVDAVAAVLRQAAPTAGVFALADDGSAEAPWRPGVALDGVLPRTLEPMLMKCFLYGLYVKPLVTVEGAVVRVAGYQGPAAHHPAYLAAATRGVLHACAAAGLADVEIDLRHLPVATPTAVELVEGLDDALRAVGTAPGFRLGAAHHAAVAAALARTLVLAA